MLSLSAWCNVANQWSSAIGPIPSVVSELVGSQDDALKKLIPAAEISKLVVRLLAALVEPVFPEIHQEVFFASFSSDGN